MLNTRTRNFFGKLGKSFDRQRVQLTLNRFESQMDTDLAPDPAVDALCPDVRDPGCVRTKARYVNGISIDNKPHQDNTQISFDYDHAALWGSRLHAQVFHRELKMLYTPFDARVFGGTDVVQAGVNSKKHGARLEVITPFSLAGAPRLLWGLDYLHEKGDFPSVTFDAAAYDASGGRAFRKVAEGTDIRTELDQQALFAQVEWRPAQSLLLRAGMRHEDILAKLPEQTAFGTPIRSGSRHFRDTVYNAGAVFYPSEALDVFVNYAQGFTAPRLDVLVFSIPVDGSLSALRPESNVVDNYEVGLRWQRDAVQAALSLFYAKSSLGAGYNQFTNRTVESPERTHGFEATLDVEATLYRARRRHVELRGRQDQNRCGHLGAAERFSHRAAESNAASGAPHRAEPAVAQPPATGVLRLARSVVQGLRSRRRSERGSVPDPQLRGGGPLQQSQPRRRPARAGIETVQKAVRATDAADRIRQHVPLPEFGRAIERQVRAQLLDMVAGAKADRLKRHRKLWLAVHRWIGLGVGLILAMVGLTGSLLVFWQPLDRLLNPALLAPEAGCSPAGHRSLDELVAAARTRVPPEGTLVRVALPETERPLLWAQYAVAVPGADWDDRHDLFVRRCSGVVLGPRLWDTQDRPWTGPLMGVVMRIHTSLLLNQRGLWLGNHILSTSCIVLMISLISGLWLWWPRAGRWRQALTVRFGSRAPRLTYDIHRTAGACSALLLLMSLFTGLHMYEPWHGFINQAVKAVSGGLGPARRTPWPNGRPANPESAPARLWPPRRPGTLTAKRSRSNCRPMDAGPMPLAWPRARSGTPK